MSEAVILISTLFMALGVVSLCIAASLRPESERKPEPQRPIIMVIEAPRREMLP